MVVAVAVASGAVLAISTRTWLAGQIAPSLAGAGPLAVTGSTAAAVVPALALVCLACAGALTIARRVGGVVVLTVLSLAALGMLAGVARVIADPESAARASIGAATGLTASSVDAADASVHSTGAVVAAGAAALVVLAAALAGWWSRRGWEARRTQRFEAPVAITPGAPKGSVDPHDGWDALSRGDDPT